jgi:hypothetical protein
MTRKDLLTLVGKEDEESKQILREHYKQRSRVIRDRFSDIIKKMKEDRPGAKVVLHHLNFNDPNYEKWENVVPMYQSDHFKVHGLHKENNSMKNPETIEKIKKALTGRKANPETVRRRIITYALPEVKAKMSGENNPMYGKTVSEEIRKKISEKVKGELNPMYGRSGENAPCYGRTGEKHPLYNTHRTDEEKKKISDGLKKMWAIKKGLIYDYE